MLISENILFLFLEAIVELLVLSCCPCPDEVAAHRRIDELPPFTQILVRGKRTFYRIHHLMRIVLVKEETVALVGLSAIELNDGVFQSARLTSRSA